MDHQTVSLVQSSWKAVEPIASQAAELFYGNLFAADPSLRSLFKGDMNEQGRKLMQMMGLAVSKLDDLNGLVPALQALAVRHKGYGVKDAHYQTVGTVLLQTLRQGLGAAFTPEVEQACASTYQTMAGVMIEAARDK